VKNSRLVYSTGVLPDEVEDNEPVTQPINEKQVKLHLDRKAGGKIVTIVRGIKPASSLEIIARELKKTCGVGGAVKNGDILIQGSHREKIKKILTGKGYSVKLSGG